MIERFLYKMRINIQQIEICGQHADKRTENDSVYAKQPKR